MTYTNFNKIFYIARATTIELIKGQVFIISLVLGVFLAIASYVGVEFSYGAPQKISLDFGMGLLSLANLGISVFLGVRLLKTEVENRTLYLVLSRPISRSSFCIGKFLGIAFVLFAIDFFIAIQTLFTYWVYEGEFYYLIPWSVLLTYLEGLIILSIVILFSLITSYIASVMYGISIYIIGHSISGLKELTFVKSSSILEKIVNFLSYFFPDLAKLNVKEHLLYGNDISLGYLYSAFFYGLTYLIITMFITISIFRNKDLD